jgi:4-amino-4-deoxy-L-arabinose transferase-like glycosyltransferase
MSPLSPHRWLIVAVSTVAIVVMATHNISKVRVTKDAAQDLQMAVNVAQHGVMSLSETTPLEPSMYREPLPIGVSAIAVALVDQLLGRADPGEYFSGARVQFVKYQNIVWLLLLWTASLAAIGAFTGSFYLAVIGALLTVKPFLSATNIAGIDNLYTELPATALLTLACMVLMMAIREGRSWIFVTSGVVFGLVALTKGAILYVFACVVLALIASSLRSGAERHRRVLQAVMMTVSFAAIVLPWIARNVQIFGQAQISERGGLALYTRALMNQMSPEEYRGTFYVWARPSIKSRIGSLLGFSQADLQLGGRLQRLAYGADSDALDADFAAERDTKPELAITDYRRGRAQRKLLTRQFEHDGVLYPDVAADSMLARQGLQMIEHDLADDVALSIPLLWRSALLLFPLVFFGIIYSLRTKNQPLTLYLLPGFAYLCFYALATPFEARPAVLAHPSAVLALLVILQALWRRVFAPASVRGLASERPVAGVSKSR